jgi:hypothetical protein
VTTDFRPLQVPLSSAMLSGVINATRTSTVAVPCHRRIPKHHWRAHLSPFNERGHGQRKWSGWRFYGSKEQGARRAPGPLTQSGGGESIMHYEGRTFPERSSAPRLATSTSGPAVMVWPGRHLIADIALVRRALTMTNSRSAEVGRVHHVAAIRFSPTEDSAPGAAGGDRHALLGRRLAQHTCHREVRSKVGVAENLNCAVLKLVARLWRGPAYASPAELLEAADPGTTPA